MTPRDTNNSPYLFLLLLTVACLFTHLFGQSSEPAASPASDAKHSASEIAQAVVQVIRSEKLDLNRVSARQLEILPGVGSRTAREVVRYRERHGAFDSVREIVKVKGVGSKTAARLEKWLRVRPAPPGSES